MASTVTELFRKNGHPVKSRKKSSVLKIHIISETAFVTKGQGVDTAFIELTQLLREKDDVEIVINGAGRGDLMHSHTYGPYYFWKGLPYKGKRILTAHVIPDSSKGTIPFWKLLLPLTKKYLTLAYSFADVIIAISPTVEKAIRDLGVKSKIVRIYNPVIIENWARTAENRRKGREILGIAENEKLILGVGQLMDRKGVEDFIDMAVAMPEVKFVWVGGRPWGMFTEGIKRINNRIKNAPPNIFFTGLRDLKVMPVMYAAADVFIFPSYQENCPLAPLEAAAAGLPVIFRDIPEYRDLYEFPYLKAASTGEFMAILKRLLNDQSFYHQSTEMSAKLIAEFDKWKIRKALMKLYKSMVDGDLIGS